MTRAGISSGPGSPSAGGDDGFRVGLMVAVAGRVWASERRASKARQTRTGRQAAAAPRTGTHADGQTNRQARLKGEAQSQGQSDAARQPRRQQGRAGQAHSSQETRRRDCGALPALPCLAAVCSRVSVVSRSHDGAPLWVKNGRGRAEQHARVTASRFGGSAPCLSSLPPFHPLLAMVSSRAGRRTRRGCPRWLAASSATGRHRAPLAPLGDGEGMLRHDSRTHPKSDGEAFAGGVQCHCFRVVVLR